MVKNDLMLLGVLTTVMVALLISLKVYEDYWMNILTNVLRSI